MLEVVVITAPALPPQKQTLGVRQIYQQYHRRHVGTCDLNLVLNGGQIGSFDILTLSDF